MLGKIPEHFLLSNKSPHAYCADMTLSASSDEISYYIQEAKSAQVKLNHFINRNTEDAHFISLGENCSTAWYLKQIGLRKASYPFDWIFSSPEIVLDCINDGFERFLNKSLFEPKDDNLSTGHLYYHSNLFHHRNPLRSCEDYNYYKRCCERFMQQIEQQNNYYLITLINEPSKRPGWMKGFTRNFSMPINQNYQTLSDLVNNLTRKNSSSKFIIIDHYTDRDRRIMSKNISENIFCMGFYAGGKSTGVFYQDYLDDFCFKLIMVGLYESEHVVQRRQIMHGDPLL